MTRCALLLALLSVGVSGDVLSSFSCAISTQTLTQSSPNATVCDYQSTSQGYVSLQWMTGTFGKLGEGLDVVLISVFVDGSPTPSLSYFPYELTGLPSEKAWNSTPRSTAWSGALFARYSATSFTNTMPILFSTGIKITLAYQGTQSSTIYYQAHGVYTSSPPLLGSIPLPLTARLVMQRSVLTLPRLAYLNVTAFPAGTSGLIAALAISFTAPNLNTLEGCFHFYPTASTPYPGQLRSTGTEDNCSEFISSYYYDLGPYQGKSSGVYYKQSTPASISMWRSYQDDPIIFTDGGAFTWRNGDTVDPATGIKCMIQEGGNPAGDPQDAAVEATTWNYVW